MKITVLDGNALNPGDLSWKPIEALGTLTVYPRTPEDMVVSRIADSDAILLNKVPITADILSKCKNLSYIGIQATGYNVVDIEACKKNGVTVTNVPAYSTAGVAQLVFAFITEFSCHVQIHSDSVMAGDWIKAPDFCYWKIPLMEMEGKTLGIFGYGNIGSRVARIAKAYGMKVIVATRTPKPEIENPVDFETLLSTADIVTLHAPLTPQTSHIVNENSLSKMKKGSFLINTARGGLVDEKAVRSALDSGFLRGYAADTISEEPMKAGNPLLGAPNCLITPHLAWAAVETRERLLSVVAENLKCYIEGHPQNVVS